MKKIYLDDRLKKYIVPTEMRDLSKAEDKLFTPGTRLPIPADARYIRLYTAWAAKDGSEDRIDVDLAASAMKTVNNELVRQDIAFYNQSSGFAVHSGDFTSCIAYKPGDKKITAEFIDIDLYNASANAVEYFLTSQFVYSGESYDPFYCVSGVQLLTELRTEKSQGININDHLFQMEISGDSLKEITEKYINSYLSDMENLNILRPTLEPKATESLDDIANFIETLLKKGVAYKTSSSDIYFNTSKDSKYLSISNRIQDEDNRESRLENIEVEKINPEDFVLWKSKKDGDLVSFSAKNIISFPSTTLFNQIDVHL